MDRRKMIYAELNGIRDGKSYGVFYRYLHRRLWNWLADTHGRKYKKDWPEWAINGGIVPMAESYCSRQRQQPPRRFRRTRLQRPLSRTMKEITTNSGSLKKIRNTSLLKCVLYTLGGNCTTKYLI
jgi:hypothetical protein